MEIEIIGDPGPAHTDTPRNLTNDEAAEVVRRGRLEGIKLHRKWTNSTLRAAVREVDAILAMPAAEMGGPT